MCEFLLIGGNGFIGRHLAQLLVAKNHKVTILCRHPCAVKRTLEKVRYVVGDYGDEHVLRSVVSERQIVVHLAHESVNLNAQCDMSLEFDKNIRPAETLIQVCINKKVNKFIVISSGGTVYGNPGLEEPLLENSITNPISLYGTSKLFVERVAQLNFYQNGLPACIVRPANAYGPGQMPFKGQGIIATAFGCAYLAQDVLMFGAGEAIRDYIHVRDVARAILAVAERGAIGEIYNVGTGVGTSIRDLLIDYIRPITEKDGYQLKISTQPARGVDVSYNVLDTSKLYLIDQAAPTSLLSGLQESWAWITNELRNS